MLLKRLNRDEPERVFVSFENSEGAQINKDATVQVDMTTDVDGVKARDMDTGNLYGFLGVADADVADNAFGLAQVYGYRSTSQVFQTSDSQATGLALVPTAAAEYLASVATTVASNSVVTLQPIYGVLLESVASSSASATTSAKVWLRAM